MMIRFIFKSTENDFMVISVLQMYNYTQSPEKIQDKRQFFGLFYENLRFNSHGIKMWLIKKEIF